jgi:hypothetical protein
MVSSAWVPGEPGPPGLRNSEPMRVVVSVAGRRFTARAIIRPPGFV